MSEGSPPTAHVPLLEHSETTTLPSIIWGLTVLFRQHGRVVSPNSLISSIPTGGDPNDPVILERIIADNQFHAYFEKRSLQSIPLITLPALLLLKDGQSCVLRHYDSQSCVVQLQESGSRPLSISTLELESSFAGTVVFIRPDERHTPSYLRAEDDELPPQKHWFWSILWKFRYVYAESALASLLVNILALAGSLFAMNVYDRVIPNNAINTLWVLAVGVTIAYLIEFLLRSLRTYFMDLAAKKADLILSAELFQQTMALRLEHRPASVGNYAGQMREFESVREFFTSASLVAIADIPFTFLFIWVIYVVAGPLAWVPVIIAPLILGAGLLAQIPLYSLVSGHFRVTTNKYAILVESVGGFESLKALGAERFMRQRWEHASLETSNSGMKMRTISGILVNFNQFLQQSTTVVIIVWGAYLVQDGQMTTGALVASSILAGRALAPLSQITGLLLRFQQTLTSYKALNKIMQIPPERSHNTSYLHKSELQQGITLKNAKFAYSKEGGVQVDVSQLTVNLGERIAILGRIGSGKTTLLRMLATLYKPSQGNLFLDGVDAQQIDPADRRKLIGYVGQEPTLFRGTLRENLVLGNPFITDHDLIRVSTAMGLTMLAARHPKGFDMPIGEGGSGLSGGQRQLIVLARMLLLNPPVLLLDEPTNSLDQHTEQGMIEQLRLVSSNKTLVVVTHKPALLALANRVIVMEGGHVVIDGEKNAVLEQLKRGIDIGKS